MLQCPQEQRHQTAEVLQCCNTGYTVEMLQCSIRIKGPNCRDNDEQIVE